MAVLPTGIGPVTNGYQIERSLRFNSADSAYLNRTPASASNRKTFTWSGWVKRGALSSSASYFLFAAGSFAGSTNTSIRILNDSINIYWGGTGGPQWTATAVLRDPSAWYHLVFAFDTTQATLGNRLKLYVNGVQSTVWSLQESTGLTAQNSDLYINNNQQHNLGASGTPGNYFDGYMTEINFVDGQALTPSSFGETDSNTGVWKPKAFSGTYGTNGFYLKFADNSGTTSTTLGKDSSGNGNNWTPNNFYVGPGTTNAEKAGIDSLVDTPTNYGTDTGVGGEVRGNYCTLNPLRKNSQTQTFANGNLDFSSTQTSTNPACVGTIGVRTGKWYWEVYITAQGNTANSVGIATTTGGLENDSVAGYNASWAYMYLASGSKRNNGTSSAYGNSWTTGDTIGVALDMDAGEVKFYKNGTVQNSGTAAFTGLADTFTSYSLVYNSGNQSYNFGQRPFSYTAPSGFKALCTTNLPTPTIGATSTTQANDYFNTVIYTGTAPSTQAVTGVGFQPDFVWVKSRSLGVGSLVYDAVRGTGSSKALQSNATDYEGLGFNVTAASSRGYISSFDSDGFTAADGTTSGQYSKANTSTYVSWNWKANGAGVTNTAGTITSTVSANTTSGFSIVTYTGNGTSGATIGHGLGAVPSFYIVKNRGSANKDWECYHISLGNTNRIRLNQTAAADTGGTMWANTTPTSTVFSVGSDADVNASTNTYVAYCFAPVAGYSAFGSYTGNGSADGPFVYTGFRPRWLLRKRYDPATTSDWQLIDTAREEYNPDDSPLWPNLPNAQSPDPAFYVDMLSNGFKLRGTTAATNLNTNGGTYIYAAFAEHPFKYSLAR